MKYALIASAALCTSAACATPPMPLHVPDGTVLQNTTGPMHYRGAAIRDMTVPAHPKEAFGEACQNAIYLPTAPSSPFPGSAMLANVANFPVLGAAWGDGGIVRALRAAQADARGGTLYDVRLDLHSTSILGIFHHDCVEVHAAVKP